MGVVDGDLWVVESETVRAAFELSGGRLASLRFRGLEVLRAADDRGDVWYGGFVMAPWAGIIPDARIDVDGRTYELDATWGTDALHGVARFAAFTPRDDVLVAHIDQGPWSGAVTLDAVATDDLLTLRLNLRADRGMPSVVGWHPWFARSLNGHQLQPIRLPESARMRSRDGHAHADAAWVGVPAGPWDDPFRGATPVRLTWPGVGSVEIDADGDVLGIYDGEDTGVAIEPMTGAPGIPTQAIAAGDDLTLATTIRWRAAP
jgi:galactose mutarotase-like enzyme